MASSWQLQDQVTRSFLNHFTCGDIMAGDQRLICVNEHATVEQGMHLMHKHKLLSLPIWNTERKAFVGMVNIFDLVMAICSLPNDKVEQIKDEDLEKAEHAALFKQPLCSLLGTSEEGKNFQVLNSSDSLARATHLFSLGTHRVLVRCGTGSAVLCQDSMAEPQAYHRVLSQTDVIRFLHANSRLPELHPLTSRTVRESGLLTSSNPANLSPTTLTVPPSVSALSVFREMSLRKISAAAIVNATDTNRLLATISTSDLRGMTAATLRYLALPVVDFLKLTRAHHHELVYCTADDTVGAVLEKALNGGVHRVWIVDGVHTLQPIGVITLTDLLALFQT